MVPVWMTFSDLFKITIIQSQITWKWYKIQLYLQWSNNRKSYMIYRTAPFSMTLNDHFSQIQGHAILWRWIYLRNGTTYRHSFNEILIGTYTRPTKQCDFAWSWMTQLSIQWHEASRGLSATAELLVSGSININQITQHCLSVRDNTRFM